MPQLPQKATVHMLSDWDEEGAAVGDGGGGGAARRRMRPLDQVEVEPGWVARVRLSSMSIRRRRCSGSWWRRRAGGVPEPRIPPPVQVMEEETERVPLAPPSWPLEMARVEAEAVALKLAVPPETMTAGVVMGARLRLGVLPLAVRLAWKVELMVALPALTLMMPEPLTARGGDGEAATAELDGARRAGGVRCRSRRCRCHRCRR